MRSLWRLALFTLGVAAATLTAAQMTIKIRTEEVRIDLLVTENHKPVLGLVPADFEVYDDGIRQEIEYASYAEIPIDAILALDMSESVAGDKLSHLRAAGNALLSGLKKDDHAALITFNYMVNLRVKLTTDIRLVRSALESAVSAGNTSLIDATYAALTVAESAEGRPLLIVFSDGLDTSSFLQGVAVLNAAKRGRSVAYAVSAGRLPNSTFLRDLCRFTGGSFFEAESTRNLEGIFLTILEEFRRRYLVCYVPQGVAPAGWHNLDVRIRRRNVTIKARPGYLRGL
jgi:VWFA-related protein